jgi:tripartite-type tricarboxylate transporter receptor subunit TctC
VPTNTPTSIVNKLNSEIYQIIQLPEVKVRLSKDGFEPVTQNSPTQFKEFLTGEINRWSKIVKELAITAE